MSGIPLLCPLLFRNPFGIAIGIALFASIPPFPLFIAKWLLLLDILNIGYNTIAIIILMVSLLSLIAYLNLSIKYSIFTLFHCLYIGNSIALNSTILNILSLSFTLLIAFLIPILILIDLEFMVPILFIESLLMSAFIVLDLFIFSICFEASLIPLFYLMIRYSGGWARRLNAALLLIIYTIAGSLLMLLGIAILYIEAGTTYLLALITIPILVVGLDAPSYQIALFSAFFIAFSIKIPIVPFHLWLPEAHVEAPTSGSILLASLFLKFGLYGIIRFAIPLFIESFIYFLPIIITIALIGIVYGLVALRQVDLKKIIAYSSIAHLNTALLGIFTNNLLALSGSIHIALAHGLISGGLFYSIGLLYDRYHSRLLRYYRGLLSHMPLYSVLFLFFILANLSFPLFTPLLAELAIIIAYPSILQLLIISLNGSYSIWLYNRLFFGTTSPSLTSFNDISRFEFYTLFIILLALFSLWTLYLYFSSLLISLLPILNFLISLYPLFLFPIPLIFTTPSL